MLLSLLLRDYNQRRDMNHLNKEIIHNLQSNPYLCSKNSIGTKRDPYCNEF